MFQNLRNGNPFYILHKNEPKLSIGEVKSVSKPMPQFNMPYQQSMLPQPTNYVEIKISVDGQDMVISDNRDAITNEIEAFKHGSEKHIADTPKHERIVAECTTMLGMLNPQIVKDTEQEKRIESLSSELADIKAMLSGLLEHSSKTEEK